MCLEDSHATLCILFLVFRILRPHIPEVKETIKRIEDLIKFIMKILDLFLGSCSVFNFFLTFTYSHLSVWCYLTIREFFFNDHTFIYSIVLFIILFIFFIFLFLILTFLIIFGDPNSYFFFVILNHFQDFLFSIYIKELLY